LCVVAGSTDYASHEYRPPLEVIIKEELPPKSIEDGQLHKTVISEEEISLSHKISKKGYYAC
jgi:hypothetical protein